MLDHIASISYTFESAETWKNGLLGSEEPWNNPIVKKSATGDRPRPPVAKTIAPQAATYSIFSYGMLPHATSTKGRPFFTPTVPKPVAVERKQRKSPFIGGRKYNT